MKRWIAYAVSAILVLAASYGLREYFRTHNDLRREPAFARMTAQALIEAFEKDSLRSNRLYVNKVLAVQGRITHLQSDENPVVISVGEDGQMSSVQCSMDSTHTDTYRSRAAGEVVTIKGVCTGALYQDLFGTDVKMSRCLIEEKRQ
jgi:hypothetical protein